MIKKDILIERFTKIHSDRYDYSLVTYKGMHKKVIIGCSIHGIFNQTPAIHLSGSGCPVCNSVKLSKSDFISRCNEIHNNKFDYSLVDFGGVCYKIIIICPTHGNFEQRAGNHSSGQGCPMCSNKRWNNEIFIKKSIKIHGDKYDYSLVDYKNAHTKIKIICPEHGEFEQIPWNHLSLKEGCPYCAENKSNLKLSKMKASTIHNNKYDYSYFTKYINVKEKIKIICPDHGEFTQKLNNHLNGQGCPICDESKGEKEIRRILDDSGFEYITEKKFDDCKYKNCLSFDFYLPEHNICIEYDGIQHFESVDFFGGISRLKYNQKVDHIKNDYCKNNNIELLRIKYTDSIKDKLNIL